MPQHLQLRERRSAAPVRRGGAPARPALHGPPSLRGRGDHRQPAMSRTVEARADRFALSRPFRISRGVRTAAEVVTVEISAGGHIGRGEGVPYARYGETVESSLAEIEAARSAVEAGADRIQLLSLMRAGAARNAVDCALWDLEAKTARRGVASLTGAPPPAALPTALTVVIDTPEAMAQA